MKTKKVLLSVLLVVTVFGLAGCAAQANQIGSIAPGPLGEFVAGFLQGVFILWVALWNVLSYFIPWGHTDAYQDGIGGWYELGFFIGLFFSIGLGFFGYRRFNRRRTV